MSAGNHLTYAPVTVQNVPDTSPSWPVVAPAATSGFRAVTISQALPKDILAQVTHFPALGTADPRAGALSIKVESDADCVVATDSVTGIFGAGESVSEALADLGQALVEHLDVLERQQALTLGLQEQLWYLRRRVPRAG